MALQISSGSFDSAPFTHLSTGFSPRFAQDDRFEMGFISMGDSCSDACLAEEPERVVCILCVTATGLVSFSYTSPTLFGFACVRLQCGPISRRAYDDAGILSAPRGRHSSTLK